MQQPRTSATNPTRSQPGDRLGVRGVRAGEVARGPRGEPGQRAGRGPDEVVVRRRQRQRLAGRARSVPSRSPRASASAARYISMRGRERPVRRRGRRRPGRAVAAPARSRRPGAAAARCRSSRSPTVSKSDTCASAPTNATPSTGRTRTTSSGSARTQRASSASRRSRLHRRHGELHEVGGPAGVAAGQGVADRLRRVAVGLEPGAGPPVQLGHLVRPARRAGARAGRRRTGGGSGTTAAGRRAGRGTGWPARARRACAWPPARPVTASQSGPVSRSRIDVAQQEVPDVGGLAGQHLLGEVVDDVAVVAGEPGDERADVVAALHATARPAAGRRSSPRCARRASRRRRSVSARPIGPLRYAAASSVGEAQVGGPDLDQLAAGAQPRQRQRRVGAGGEDQVQLRRQVLEQERHPVVDLAARR